VLRTIGALLGLPPLGLNDALATPMADVFDPALAEWTYKAIASPVLKTTALPIPADRYPAIALEGAAQCPLRTADYWAKAMAGQDFSSEDRLDTAAFNRALWTGLGNGPEPAARPGEDLRANRAALLEHASAARGCS
jgi:hypothetical protein